MSEVTKLSDKESSLGPTDGDGDRVMIPIKKGPAEQLQDFLDGIFNQVNQNNGLVDPPPLDNYSAAFDPTSDMYSINTGNASVRQLEDLKSIMGDTPQILPTPPDDKKYLVGAALAIGIFYVLKGRF